MSLLSVIIPVYNAAHCLEKCVDSLVNQTYKDLEIILVDDGSTDTSGALCDALATKDGRIKVIHKQNGGVSSARNAGLDAANGQYIIFADSYSIFETDILEKCMAQIAAHNPDMLVCAVKAPAEDKRSRLYLDGNMYTRYEYTENIARYISLGVGFDTVANKIFAANIVQSRNVRFSTDMPMVSDQLFNCRCFTAAGHIRCTGDLLCHCDETAPAQTAGTADYLAQGKEYSQKLIDAVQSKGLYGAASQVIGENYQKILYRHLVLLCTADGISQQQRIEALENLSQSSDYGPLMMYLSTLRGIKNQSVYQMFKLRQWRLLITVIGSQA